MIRRKELDTVTKNQNAKLQARAQEGPMFVAPRPQVRSCVLYTMTHCSLIMTLV